MLSSTLWYPDSFMLPSAMPVSENLHLRSHQASPTRHSPKYGIPCGELHVSFCMLPSSQLHFILPSEAPVCAAGRRPKALRFRRRSLGPPPPTYQVGAMALSWKEPWNQTAAWHTPPFSLFLLPIAHDEDAWAGRKCLSENVPRADHN